MVEDAELLRIAHSWPVSTIDGEPSLTRGSLNVLRGPRGDYLLVLTSGDEHHPDGDEIQFPISADHAELVRRALAGEHVGEFVE